MKTKINLFLFLIAISFMACKSGAEKRKECEAAIPQLIDNWFSDVVGDEDKAKMENMVDLYKSIEADKDCEVIDFDPSGTPSPQLLQFIKDEVAFSGGMDANSHRYDNYKQNLPNVGLVCFPSTWNGPAVLMSPEDLFYHKPSRFINESSLRQSIFSKIPEDGDVESFKRNALSDLEHDYKEYYKYSFAYDYIAFVNVKQYVRPKFDQNAKYGATGMIGAQLSVYSISDKNKIFEKKIYVQNLDGYDPSLADFLRWEVNLQLEKYAKIPSSR